MEKIKVNMSPNPLDVQTIHASQNDGEARQWEFELHNNGELIDTSEITEQMVFKSYKGGTEQLLPENGSTPTTSPFLGDIRYPQGLLTDQEFTYRESPTEEDGLAKITDIKGNTLVWNQLIQNGNFADTSNWSAESGATLSISNNIATISSTAANNGIKQYFLFPLTVGHKYLIKAEFNVPTEYRCVIGTAANQGVQTDKLISTANTWTEVSGIGTCTVATTAFYCFVRGTTYENVKVRNVMLFDLTQMGLDISSPSDFTSLFPLSYYSYNQGSLLSFMGNGLKTVGFNLCDNEWEKKSVNSSGVKVANNSAICNVSLINVSLHGSYYFHIDNVPFTPNGRYIHKFGANLEYLGYSGINNDSVVTIPDDTFYIYIQINRSGNITEDITQTRVNFNISDSSKNGTYEPYTSSTLSLPISTYFPNGMKSAGSVYDELTESKAITRVGAVDLGTLNWSQRLIGTTPIGMQTNGLSATIKNPSTNNDIANIISTAGTASSWTIAMGGNSSSGLMAVSGGYLFIATTETNPTAFKSAMSGVYLYYELATPTETSFTTASLVTENAEIPLSNEDGVLIGKCTEELSSQPGFIDAKIKLTDGDGTCYSNKIQLHVERKP